MYSIFLSQRIKLRGYNSFDTNIKSNVSSLAKNPKSMFKTFQRFLYNLICAFSTESVKNFSSDLNFVSKKIRNSKKRYFRAIFQINKRKFKEF